MWAFRSLQGPAGIFGPSCELCALLATEEINLENGVLGRELRLRRIDAGQNPSLVAENVFRLVKQGRLDAVVGWHLSSVRQAVAPRISGRVPYIYTALYEGGERTPGVFVVGETPIRQLLPAMRWLRNEYGVRRWCIVGTTTCGRGRRPPPHIGPSSFATG
jgi:ABC-type branched-subunit amino acid transport system substrate-binding protein